MAVNPAESTVLKRLVVTVGATGCALLCLRTVRLVGVGLAIALKKRGGPAKITERPYWADKPRTPENTK